MLHFKDGGILILLELFVIFEVSTSLVLTVLFLAKIYIYLKDLIGQNYLFVFNK